jgi:hypothetical protein
MRCLHVCKAEGPQGPQTASKSRLQVWSRFVARGDLATRRKDADIKGVIPDAPDMDVDVTEVEVDASKGLESHWRIFRNLGTPATKREVKRCQTALRAMIAHDRWVFKNCPDVAITDWWIKATLVAFINSLARTAHRLRDYAHRLLAFINRAEAIRKHHMQRFLSGLVEPAGELP